MTERKINERRNWKAETFPYDYFIPDGTKECQYCLTEKQAEILRGIIAPLGWKTRWWSEAGATIDSDKIEEFRDDLIRRLMMGCCGDETPVQYRYDSDGNLQKSTDGGATWEDAPQDDTRLNSPQFPPVVVPEGDDVKCIAAAGGATLVKEQVGDQLTDDMGRYTLSQLITDWTKTFINTSDPLQALLTVVANQIFALVIATLRPALTDTVYHLFQCILYCNMADDASFDNAKWATVRSDITSQIGGIAGIFLEHLVYLLGAGGLTNLVRAGGATTGDCSDCAQCQSCADQYSLYCGTGADFVHGDGWVQATSVESGLSGGQSVAITTNNPDLNCYMLRTETPEGTPISLFTAYRLPGEAIPSCGSGFGHLTLNCTIATNTVLFYNNSHEVFHVRIFIGDAPCP